MTATSTGFIQSSRLLIFRSMLAITFRSSVTRISFSGLRVSQLHSGHDLVTVSFTADFSFRSFAFRYRRSYSSSSIDALAAKRRSAQCQRSTFLSNSFQH